MPILIIGFLQGVGNELKPTFNCGGSVELCGLFTVLQPLTNKRGNNMITQDELDVFVNELLEKQK